MSNGYSFTNGYCFTKKEREETKPLNYVVSPFFKLTHLYPNGLFKTIINSNIKVPHLTFTPTTSICNHVTQSK